MKKTFVFYSDWIDYTNEMTLEEKGIFLETILNYQNGKEIGDLGSMKFIRSRIKKQLDEDNEKSRCGEYHRNWKGGISTENHRLRNSTEYREWRNAVFSRDNYTCLHCGNVGGELNAHHIKKFSENRDLIFKIDNGITLCKQCHILVHKKQ